MHAARRLLVLFFAGTMVFGPPGALRAVPGAQTELPAATANGAGTGFSDCGHDNSGGSACLGHCGSTSACAVMTGPQAPVIALAAGAAPACLYLILVGVAAPPDSQPPKVFART